MSERAAVAVGGWHALAQLDSLSREDCVQRGPSRHAGPCARAGLAGLGYDWSFNRREADCSPVVEEESAAIRNRVHLSGPDRFQAAHIRGEQTGLGKGARDRPNDHGGEAEKLAMPGNCGIPRPTHRITKRLEFGGTPAGCAQVIIEATRCGA